MYGLGTLFEKRHLVLDNCIEYPVISSTDEESHLQYAFTL